MRAEAGARPDGFTLLEMMAVLAVIAILALMAAPGFHDRIVRNQINDALPLADLAKKAVEASWAASQSLPADNAAAGIPAPDKIVGNYVTAVELREGAVHITLGNRANAGIRGKVLTVRPAIVEDAPTVPVAWLCGAAEAPDMMTAKGENRTNIPANLLPLACRSWKGAK